MKWWIGAALLVLVLGGCGPKASGAQNETETPADNLPPAQKLREQLSSGAFFTDATLESIASAMDLARKLVDASDAPRKAASGEVIEIIEQCGKRLADLAEAPPPLSEIDADFSSFDEKRLRAIEKMNDCIHDLNDAFGILGSVVDGSPANFGTIATQLQGILLTAIEDASAATTAFGGEVEDVE